MSDIWETTDEGKFVFQDKNLAVRAVKLKLELVYLNQSTAQIYADLRGRLTHKQIQDFKQGAGLPPLHLDLVKKLIHWNNADEEYFKSFFASEIAL